MESGYYPLGAENDPLAPWNQSDPDEEEVKIMVSQTLSKNNITCYTSDYIPGEREVDYDTDIDENGNRVTIKEMYYGPSDFSNTNWVSVADNNGVCTPLEIINTFKEALITLKDNKELPDHYKDWRWLDYMIKQCSEWIEDETVIYQDE